MKRVIILLLALLPVMSFGQQKPEKQPLQKIKISKTLTALPGEVYLDSVKVDITKTFLDSDNIRAVKIYKVDKKNKASKGATLITRKSKPKLSSLQSLVDNAKADNVKLKEAKKINVLINGNLVSNYNGYQFEKSAIQKVDIITADKKGVTREGTTPSIIITTKKPTRINK